MIKTLRIFFVEVGGLFWALGGCVHSPSVLLKSSGPSCLTEHRVPSMGTFFEFQLVHSCDFDPSSFVRDARAILDSMESELSLYQPMSSLSQLNRQGRFCAEKPWLKELIQFSKDYQKRTRGAFEITIGPVLNEIQQSFQKRNKPPENLERFRPLVNSQFIQFVQRDRDCVVFEKKGMQITLDGIAKGFAVDELSKQIPVAIASYLLNFSGNMKWKGRKPDGPWRIGFWNPVTQTVTVIVSPESGAISTSGPENASYDKQQEWHHIINPKTLKPSLEYSSVTVMGTSAMECDILSTSFMNLRRNEAWELRQEEFPQTTLWLIDRQGRVEQKN